ncbi:hypothetical protein ACVXG7_13930 [Enterobacter hormaechei]
MEVSPDGKTVTGTAEPGSTVTRRCRWQHHRNGQSG